MARPVLVAVGRVIMRLLGLASFCLNFTLVQWFLFPAMLSIVRAVGKLQLTVNQCEA
jgi:hypothetical protein